jgi:hypothetical protein
MPSKNLPSNAILIKFLIPPFFLTFSKCSSSNLESSSQIKFQLKLAQKYLAPQFEILISFKDDELIPEVCAELLIKVTLLKELEFVLMIVQL